MSANPDVIPPSARTALLASPRRQSAVLWALLAGNFVIGTGVMIVAGTLNEISRAFRVEPAVAGQLITAAAAVMCIGAPLLASAVARWDRRVLLTLSLLWYAAGHLAADYRRRRRYDGRPERENGMVDEKLDDSRAGPSGRADDCDSSAHIENTSRTCSMLELWRPTSGRRTVP